jgi:serine/threonine protein kinase
MIKKMLGQGGMGAALLAVDLRLDSKLVVIKELLSDTIDSTKFGSDVRNFKREVAMLAHIDHPLVPGVTDHFQEELSYFMVQEYVDGENLEDLLMRLQQPMQEREVLVCASEILDILDYLAQQLSPVVHRDIKPSNIVIGARDRKAHLVDFGIARVQVVRNTRLQQTSALGTPGYAPPEQYQGHADPRSDLYGLAATMHHLLTNRDPRHYTPFIYPPVRTLNPLISPELEHILTHALSNDTNQRYQSAAAMKQEIGNILLKRFGIRTTSSYLLGTSGPIHPAQAEHVPPGTAAVARPPSPQQPKRNLWLPTLLIAILLLSTLSAAFYFLLPYVSNFGPQQPTVTPATPTIVTNDGIGVVHIGNESIGISDGSFAFDTSRTNGKLKEQAAISFRKGDVSSAISLWKQAASEQTDDAEALIYLENQRIINRIHLTIVVGTMLSGDGSIISTGRENLQGAYVAQKEFNSWAKLNSGIQVRLLIASSGSKTAYAKQVAEQIVQLAHKDPTFVGVMGWPFSSRAVQAIQVLGKAHIPMVSPTASSDHLTGASPYFFRVAPPNKQQAIFGAKYAHHELHAETAAIFVDIADPYSQSLAQYFTQQFEADGNEVIATERYTIGKPETIPDLLHDALSKNPDMIYFSGYATDVGVLLSHLPPGNLPIMGGDALYELGGYPKEARPGFNRLRFTTFAYPDEWDVLGLSMQKPQFFKDYSAAFNPDGKKKQGVYAFTRAANDVILSYDATVALLVGCNNVLNAGKKSLTREDVREGLSKITEANAIQGVSGRISFKSDGDPDNKAIVILYVDSGGFIKMESTIEGRFLK